MFLYNCQSVTLRCVIPVVCVRQSLLVTSGMLTHTANNSSMHYLQQISVHILKMATVAKKCTKIAMTPKPGLCGWCILSHLPQ